MRRGALAVALVVLASARAAAAEERADAPEAKAAVPRAVPSRRFLFGADPAAPGPLDAVLGVGAGYASLERGVGRPFAGNVAGAGAVFGVDGEVGLLRVASIVGQGLLAGEGSGKVGAGALLGVSLHPWPAGHGPIDVAVSGGYLRELGGANGVWARLGVAGDVGALRLGGTALAQHAFAGGRDAVDLVLTAGASYEVARLLRLGAEYVVQDLEGALERDEAEGGVRHFAGPTAGLALGRVQLAAGPAFGLSAASPRVLGRLAASYAF